MKANTPAPSAEDYELADLAKARRELHPTSQPTTDELTAINRIIVEQTRQRLLACRAGYHTAQVGAKKLMP